jgi:hypothetical protein
LPPAVPQIKLALPARIVLVQHINGFHGEGGKAYETFMTAAKEKLASR